MLFLILNYIVLLSSLTIILLLILLILLIFLILLFLLILTASYQDDGSGSPGSKRPFKGRGSAAPPVKKVGLVGMWLLWGSQ